MFFKLNDSKNGIITSVCIDYNKLDENVINHLIEVFPKKKIKINKESNIIIIKTDITLNELNKLNDGYAKFHSDFVTDNLFKIKLKPDETIVESSSE